MQLKQVDIFGFKTFADKVEMHFSPGITAIVGPNGCGKTNTLDAIRWVLGEQSSRVLRSNKMEDVIYNGGNSRKPLNFAEVSLTFENNKKVLPIEYDEVKITRRLYRSGESEYYINKSECRLKDISDLFMDTGVGSHVYSIIEQSQIDLILSNNPSLRRMLFEEAAGVMKYKTRKKETLNKLEHTEQNLLRVNDIVNEVVRQSELLKTQASRANKYLEYRNEVKELDQRLTLLEYTDVETLSREASQQLLNLTESKKNIQAEVSNSDAQMEAFKTEIIGVDRKIAEEHEVQFKLNSELDKIESTIALNKERIEGLETQKTRELNNRNSYEDKIKQNTQELSALEVDLENVKKEIDQKTVKINDLNVVLEEIKKEFKDKEKRLDEHKTSELDLRKKITSCEVTLKTYETKREEFVNNKNRIEEEKHQLIQNKKSLEEKKDLAENEIKQMEVEKETLRQNSGNLASELDKSKQQLATSETLVYAKFGEKKEKESRLSTLKSLKDSLSGYFTGVKEVLQHKRNGNFKGCIGPVADLIRTEAKYERAMEIALGANIQNIVTESTKDAKEAIEYLKKQNKGRATFLPLDLVNIQDNSREPEESVLNKEGVIGSAIDLIEFDKKYSNIMKYLLNKVIIVRTMDNAVDIVSSGNSRGSYRFVTLDGEMINNAGAITGGSIDARNSGLLGRERELEELTKRVTDLESELQRELDKAKNLKEKISELVINIEDANKKYRVKEMDLVNKTNIKNNYAVDFEKIIKQIDALEESIKRVEKDTESSYQEKLNIEKELFELESSLGNLSKFSLEVVEDMSENRKKLEKLQSEWTELKMSLASREEKLMYSENSRKSLAKNISELSDSIIMFEVNLKKYDEDKVTLENDIKEKEKSIIELFEKRKSKGTEIFSIEEKHRELQESIRKIEDSAKEKKKEFDKLQEEWFKLEVKNQEVQLKISNLVEKLKRDFALTDENLKNIEIQEEIDRDSLREKIELLRTRMIKMEPVNIMAIEEYKVISERLEFLLSQKKDLEEAKDVLMKTIDKINDTSDKNFKETFELIKNNFIYVFKRFFNGGNADLTLIEGAENTEPGIEIIAQPPGKKPQTITLLSGGERALTAIALIFGIFMVKPSPFCILDEVDAPLDDTNVLKYLSMIEEFSKHSQFITITHNKITMGKANTLYGVTMEELGVSKLMSIRFQEADKIVEQNT